RQVRLLQVERRSCREGRADLSRIGRGWSSARRLGPNDRGPGPSRAVSRDVAAQPVPLKTRFHAVVDGTNGDTALEHVEARVIDTLIVARGAVVRTKDVKGRRISLDVAIDDGRMEDVLKLAVRSTKPIMTGRMQ